MSLQTSLTLQCLKMKKQHIDNLQELRSDNNQQKLRSNNEDTQQEQRSKNNDNNTNRHSTREQRPPSDPLSNVMVAQVEKATEMVSNL